MDPTSLPVLLLDAAWFFGSVAFFLVGAIRSARAGGGPVSFGALARPPATPWAPLGLVLGGLCVLWVIATLLLPAFVAWSA